MEKYQELYEKFISDYKKTVTSGEDIGETICRLAQEFATCNLFLGRFDEALNRIYAKLSDSMDEQSGKPISMAKAEIKVKDTDEYRDYAKAKISIQNIEQYINALKSLQRGILNEYSHMNT